MKEDTMADQSLRTAQLRQEFRAEIMRGYQAALCNSDVPGWTLGDEVAKVADNLLAARPAEPAPVVTDEAVAAAAREFYGRAYGSVGPEGNKALHEGAREALEAAAPLLGPRPLLDRESVTAAIRAEVASYGITPSTAQPKAVDAVMELARPMPTQDEIDSLLQEWRVRPSGQPTQQEAVNYRRKMRNALLALLNGAES